MSTFDKAISFERKYYLTKELVIIDGQPGCGKTLFSSIFSSFKRVEIMNYAFEIEWIAKLYKMNKISEDAANSLILMLSDQKLYQTMMGRDTNFRYSDLSSVFNNPFPLTYFSRIFSEGDRSVPKKIKKEKPIMSFTTHDMLDFSDIIFKTFKKMVTFVEIVRHPLYMVKQQTVNMSELTNNNPRDVALYFDYNNRSLPYFAKDWEDLFIKSNDVDKAIYSMEKSYYSNKDKREKLKKNSQIKFITIPFENFVLKPNNYLNKILELLNTEFSSKTKKILSKQRVPRKKIADGISLKIYKRYLWESSKNNTTEKEEILLRRDWAIDKGASMAAIKSLDEISNDYSNTFLN